MKLKSHQQSPSWVYAKGSTTRAWADYMGLEAGPRNRRNAKKGRQDTPGHLASSFMLHRDLKEWVLQLTHHPPGWAAGRLCSGSKALPGSQKHCLSTCYRPGSTPSPVSPAWFPQDREHDNIPKPGSDRGEVRALAVSQMSYFSTLENPQASEDDLCEGTVLQLPLTVIDEVLLQQICLASVALGYLF